MTLASFLAGLATGMILVALLVLGAVGVDTASDMWREIVRGFQRNPR